MSEPYKVDPIGPCWIVVHSDGGHIESNRSTVFKNKPDALDACALANAAAASLAAVTAERAARCRELEGALRKSQYFGGVCCGCGARPGNQHADNCPVEALLTPATPAAMVKCKRCGDTGRVPNGCNDDRDNCPECQTTETPAFKPRRFVYGDDSTAFWQTEPNGKVGVYRKGERISNSSYTLVGLTNPKEGFREVPIPDETPAPTCGLCGGTGGAGMYYPCPACATAEGGVA